MPKFVAVVGAKHSGKTVIIQQLVPVLKRRGYHVATIKEMKSAKTKAAPKTSKDTLKQSEPDAEIFVASPLNETTLILKKKISLKEIVPFLNGMDYIVLEGFDKEKVFAKITAAKAAREAASFSDGLAIAISGRVTETKQETQKASALQIPLFNIKNQAEELANVVEEKAFSMLPNLLDCAKCHPVGECGFPTCYDNAKAIVSGKSKARCCPLSQKEKFCIEVNGVKVPLKNFPEAIIQNMLLGMLSSLHETEDIESFKIEMNKP